MDEDEIRRAVARGIRDHQRSQPKPKGVVDDVSGAACGCVVMFVVALVVMGMIVASNR
ncbi:hypothetical protein ACFZBM_14065 [Streptomyces lavendulae]|uniref:Uncharacterized protein n=1 Tax=Streptomyces lavendulae subsp. lavendulae TaxID=58340 RepID=A0A2K8PGG6_STRLA|nr:hypothetical protein [Streptomyces lavendulae]ATZ25836.1 hypothetical protein SLAV_20060 [Streptomyces lavendulae subsp. lavendulae]QUQ55665.1 hypothetical protein SLLC_18165 [Streptomyces lavendulae subsp. lavendulae]